MKILRTRIFKMLAGRLPSSVREWLFRLVVFAGFTAEPEMWVGSKLFFSISFSFLAALFPWTVFNYTHHILFEYGSLDFETAKPILFLSFLMFALTFILCSLFYALFLYFAMDDRTKRVEKVLPDFLLLVAAHMRAGMTPFSAFRSSARSEFGPLEDEIKIATARSLGTESFEEALEDLSERINSETLRKTIVIFNKGLRSGGQMARLLEEIAGDIRETEELRQELISSTRMYSIFLVFIVVIAVPILLSISVHFLTVLSGLQSHSASAGLGGASSFALFASANPLDPEFVINASYLFLIGTALLVSILIGLIGEGKVLYGLKFFLPISVISVIIFYVARMLLSQLLSAII